MKKILFITFFLVIFIIRFSFAQDVVISDKTEKVNGKEYYLHTVKIGETVWEIAKAYSVTTEDIYTVNPDTKKEIKPGQVIKVIVKNKKVEYVKHTVEKGETLYKIAKKYSVTVDKIKEANPDLTDKIKDGQILKIPVKPAVISNETNVVIGADTTQNKIEDISEYDCNKPKLLDSYNIALLIPFYLNQMYQIKTDDPEIDEKDPDDYSSFTFIQFYEGILMAIDSLKKSGLSAKIYVYDVDEDSSKVISLLEKPEMQKMHMIIGPFFPSSLKPVVAFAKKHNIKVIDPISTDDDILTDNPNVIKATPSVSSQFEELATYFTKTYPTATIIIAHNNKENELKYVNALKTALNNEYKKTGKTENSFKEAIISQVGIGGITKMFNPNDTNIIFTLTTGEIFVTNYVRNLSDVYTNYKMIVVGLPSWKNYDNIEPEYFQEINLHLFSSSCVDYSRDDVKKFILRYRGKYKTEPTKYAYLGFDIGMLFLKAIKNQGTSFEKCLDKYSGTYLQNNYNFVKSDKNSGYENKELNIFRYYKFNLIDARTSKSLGLTQKEKK